MSGEVSGLDSIPIDEIRAAEVALRGIARKTPLIPLNKQVEGKEVGPQTLVRLVKACGSVSAEHY